MAKIYNAVQKMWTDTRGQDLLEYALIAGLLRSRRLPGVTTSISKADKIFSP